MHRLRVLSVQIAFVLCSIVSAQKVFAQACLAHRPDDPSVPECGSTNGGVLSGAFPAMAVSISDSSGGATWIKSFVQDVLEAEPDKPPQFILNVRDDTLHEVQQMIKKMNISDEKKTFYLSSLTQAKSEDRWNWQQDYMQPVVDKSGAPVVRPDANYRRGLGARDSVMKAVSEACKVPASAPYATDLADQTNGTFGGNLSGGPAGSCVVGDDHFIGRDWQKVSGDICKNNSAIIQAPTAFLAVGHTDEIFSAVRTGPGKCDIAVIVASPAAALDVLKKDGDGKALPLATTYINDPIKSRRNVVKPDLVEDYYASLCDVALRAPPPSGDPKSPKNNQKVNKFLFLLNPEAVADSSSYDDESRDSDSDSCGTLLKSMKNSDVVNYVNSDPNLKALNDQIQSEMTEFKGKMSSQMAVNGCPAPKIADVGSLFLGKAKLGPTVGGRTSVTAEKSLGVFPNLTNMQQFGNTIIAPDPGNEALRKDYIAKIASLGPDLKVKFIDTQHAHLKAGNLHCSTNAIRYCRPPAGTTRAQ